MRWVCWSLMAAALAASNGCYFNSNPPASQHNDAGVDGPHDDGGPNADAADDFDGDGIADDVDNCPTVSNANQRDFDDDDIGDACDLCPHVKTEGPVLDDPDADFIDSACDPEPNTPNTLLWFEGAYEPLAASWTNVGNAWSVEARRLSNGGASPALAWRTPAVNWLYVEARGLIQSVGTGSPYVGLAAMVAADDGVFVGCGVTQVPGQGWHLRGQVPSLGAEHVVVEPIPLEEDEPFLLRVTAGYFSPNGPVRTLSAQCDIRQAQPIGTLQSSVAPGDGINMFPDGGGGIVAENATYELRYVVAYGR